MTEVRWRPAAKQQLSDLDPVAQEQISDRVTAATEWTSHYVEQLSGQPYYKLRAGKYRAIVTWNQTKDQLVIEALGHRRSVYDRCLPA